MSAQHHQRKGLLAPNPAMWQALDEGRLLREILEDFYARVYTDARLASFFEGVTIARAIDKQYSFLRSVFTGERCYFGDHPKRAHHWMVISNELFDYREALMEDTLRRHGLPEELVRQWRAMEEVFRKAIVKQRPQARKVGPYHVPVEGYSTLKLDVSTLCDECGQEIHADTVVSYHNRTGKVACKTCHDPTS